MKTLRACLKTRRDAVFAPKAGWRGATRENIPGGSSTEEQRSQTAFGAKTLRAAALLPAGCVGSFLTARCGDARNSPPCLRPKSLAAAPRRVFKQALRKISAWLSRAAGRVWLVLGNLRPVLSRGLEIGADYSRFAGRLRGKGRRVFGWGIFSGDLAGNVGRSWGPSGIGPYQANERGLPGGILSRVAGRRSFRSGTGRLPVGATNGLKKSVLSKLLASRQKGRAGRPCYPGKFSVSTLISRRLEHFNKYCSRAGLEKKGSGLFGFWLRFRSVTAPPAGMVLPDWHHSLSLARKPKILAPNGYIISCNALGQKRAFFAPFLTLNHLDFLGTYRESAKKLF